MSRKHSGQKSGSVMLYISILKANFFCSKCVERFCYNLSKCDLSEKYSGVVPIGRCSPTGVRAYYDSYLLHSLQLHQTLKVPFFIEEICTSYVKLLNGPPTGPLPDSFHNRNHYRIGKTYPAHQRQSERHSQLQIIDHFVRKTAHFECKNGTMFSIIFTFPSLFNT